MDDSLHVWRAHPGSRIVSTAFAALMVAGALTPWDDHGVGAFPPDGSGDYRHGFGYRLLLVALAGVLLAWTYRARMDLTSRELVVRSLLWTRRIALSDIADVTPGPDGLSITLRDGRERSSPTLVGAKAPIASWLHRTTRADRIARTIMDARP